MKKNEFALSYGWSLITHEDCSLFVDITNPNRYSLIDWDKDLVIISVQEHTYKFERTYYDLKHEVNIANRTITILNEPEKD